jgi:hypothetical protein
MRLSWLALYAEPSIAKGRSCGADDRWSYVSSVGKRDVKSWVLRVYSPVDFESHRLSSTTGPIRALAERVPGCPIKCSQGHASHLTIVVCEGRKEHSSPVAAHRIGRIVRSGRRRRIDVPDVRQRVDTSLPSREMALRIRRPTISGHPWTSRWRGLEMTTPRPSGESFAHDGVLTRAAREAGWRRTGLRRSIVRLPSGRADEVDRPIKSTARRRFRRAY